MAPVMSVWWSSVKVFAFATIVTAAPPHSRTILQTNPSSIVFSCTFERDSCDMKNQEVTEALWQRKNINVGNEMGPAMVVNGRQANNRIARLLTPNIPTYDRDNGCLEFRYYIRGRSASSLSVIKQGYTTEYIFATAFPTRNLWKNALVDVKLYGDSVFFYFEADTKVQEVGASIVAIKDVRFNLRPCSQERSLPTRRRNYRG